MIYEDTSYGINGAKAIEEESKEANVCFALNAKASESNTEEDLTRLSEMILKNVNTNGRLRTYNVTLPE